ncbi:hypothetical protein [Thermosyntropha sp.]|nr:hypothetical protein [Thermosyntropha sp.]MBO8158915.1 hypothetical protein [Thermosyntropha sp.]
MFDRGDIMTDAETTALIILLLLLGGGILAAIIGVFIFSDRDYWKDLFK